MAALNSKITKQFLIFAIFSLVAVIAITLMMSLAKHQEINLNSVISVQKESPFLWILDILPFFLLVLWHYIRKTNNLKSETLLVDPTESEKADNMDSIDRALREVLHDPLTGLPNRVLFKDLIEYGIKMSDRDKSKLSIFVLDIDRFKEINNTLGHFSGDLLLRAVSKRLKEVLRKSDTLARFSGDEFAILCPEIKNSEDLKIILRKIEKAFGPAFVLEGISLDVKASIGAVIYPDHGEDPETLLKRADIAVSVAKEKNERFVVYDPETDNFSSYRLSLMGELKHAIDEDDLELYYQPKIDVGTKQIAGAEALVRWKHKEYGMILPDEFVNVAERTGLINPLFQWVAKNASKKATQWQKSGIDISMSINLSASNLLDPKLIDLITELPALYGVSPENIIFEITETAIMSDPNLSMAIISDLKKRGFRFSIDDFGTGYSSFAYLARLPISEIKIDKSFVSEMLKSQTNYIIVYTAIEMAHNLGLKIVAEGVETEEVLNELTLMGCDLAQGYLINKPLCSSEFDSWARSSKWGRGLINKQVTEL